VVESIKSTLSSKEYASSKEYFEILVSIIWRCKISVRTFSWHDLFTFYRYRRQVVCTDSAQALTHGDPTSPLAFLGRINPAVGIYTSINPGSDSDGAFPLIGQIQYADGERSARIVFLMPDDGLTQPGLADLLEDLAIRAGGWGAFHLLAEVEENSCAMDGLRRSGFSVYAWQRIWKFLPSANRVSNGDGKNGAAMWHPAASVDEVMIRNLYHSLVPPLVQSAEPLTPHRPLGWTYRQDGEILAYVEGFYGPQGIYLQPLIHPGVENVSHVLSNLLINQRNPLGRPIYMAVRSYQAWLETVVRDLECQVGPRQALMVKHLVAQQRAAVQVARHSVLEKYPLEPTVPMVHNSTATNK
jgi:hypothetical protein